MKKYIITLDPAVVKFLQEYGTISTEVNGDTIFKTYRLPSWTLSHRELNEFEVINKSSERYFYVSYNGIDISDNKTIIGHLSFAHKGFPSMLYITEQLIPNYIKRPITDIVMLSFIEFNNESDFDEFTTGRDMGSQLGDLISQN